MVMATSSGRSGSRRKSMSARQAEEELRYRAALLDNANDAIISTDANFTVRTWNRAAEVLYGWSAQEAIGRRTSDVLPVASYEGGKSREEVAREFLEKGLWRGEATYRRKDGSAITVMSSSIAMKDDNGTITGGLAIHTDVTERKKVEQELRESEERFLKSFTLSPVPMTLARLPEGRWVEANDSFLRLTEFTREEVIGHTSAELGMFPRPEERVQTMKTFLEQGRVRDREHTVRTKSGKLITVLSFSEKITINGQEHAVSTIVDVTERKKAEELLRASEEQYRLIVETANEGVWLGALDGKTLFVNQRMADMLGYSRQEMLGRIGAEFLDQGDRASVPETRRRLDGGNRVSRELRFRRKDGSVLWSMASVSPILDGQGRHSANLSMHADITEHKKAEEALARTAQQLAAHMENSPLAIVEFDPQFRVTRWSAGAERLFGWTADEMLCRGIAEVRWVHEEDAAAVNQVWADMVSGKLPRNMSANRNYRKDGSVIHCEWYNSAIYDADGKLASVLSRVLDVTERKELDQAKDDFIGFVSHELRTPLTVVIAALGTGLTPGITSEETQELLKEAANSAQTLSHIVDNLLELSRHRTDKLTLEKKRLDLSSAILSAVKKEREHSPAHRFLVDVAADLPPVNADPVRFGLIMRNLLDNAAKYSPALSDVTVGARWQHDRAVVSVKDHGQGIPPHQQDRLFQPFERLDDTRVTVKGLGLGLMVCQRLVEAHGGTIWFESEVGKGTTFFFTLPAM